MEKTKIIESAVSKLMKMFESGEFPAQLAATIIRKNEAGRDTVRQLEYRQQDSYGIAKHE